MLLINKSNIDSMYNSHIIYNIYISRINGIFRGSKRGVQKGGPKDPFGGVQMRGSMFYPHPSAGVTVVSERHGHQVGSSPPVLRHNYLIFILSYVTTTALTQKYHAVYPDGISIQHTHTHKCFVRVRFTMYECYTCH